MSMNVVKMSISMSGRVCAIAHGREIRHLKLHYCSLALFGMTSSPTREIRTNEYFRRMRSNLRMVSDTVDAPPRPRTGTSSTGASPRTREELSGSSHEARDWTHQVRSDLRREDRVRRQRPGDGLELVVTELPGVEVDRLAEVILQKLLKPRSRPSSLTRPWSACGRRDSRESNGLS